MSKVLPLTNFQSMQTKQLWFSTYYYEHSNGESQVLTALIFNQLACITYLLFTLLLLFFHFLCYAFVMGSTPTYDGEHGRGRLDPSHFIAGFAMVFSCLQGLEIPQEQIVVVLVHLSVQQGPVVVPGEEGVQK